MLYPAIVFSAHRRITPTEFRVIVNGGFLERVASEARDRLYARAIVMEKGAVRIPVVVVD